MRLNKDESLSVLIHAKIFWNDTGLEVQPDEFYLFEASGIWKDFGKKTDAEGYSNLYMSLFNRWKRARNSKWFALIGSIDKNHDFFIGNHKKILVARAGKLFCYANDVPNFYWNNSGQLSLKITRL